MFRDSRVAIVIVLLMYLAAGTADFAYQVEIESANQQAGG